MLTCILFQCSGVYHHVTMHSSVNKCISCSVLSNTLSMPTLVNYMASYTVCIKTIQGSFSSSFLSCTNPILRVYCLIFDLGTWALFDRIQFRKSGLGFGILNDLEIWNLLQVFRVSFLIHRMDLMVELLIQLCR